MLKMKRFSIFAFICKAKCFAIACNSSSKYFSWYWYVGLYIQLLLSIRKMIRPFRGAIQVIQLSWENIYDINAKIRQTFNFVVITNKLLIYYFIYFFLSIKLFNYTPCGRNLLPKSTYLPNWRLLANVRDSFCIFFYWKWQSQ